MYHRKEKFLTYRRFSSRLGALSSTKPKTIIHDGLPSYDKAFRKEFFTHTIPRATNVRSISVRHEGLNSKVDRLNGSVRDRAIVMSGMAHKESAQELLEASGYTTTTSSHIRD